MEGSKLTKSLADKLLKLKGEARGIHFKNDADYVSVKKGKKDLKKVEEELERVGCPLKYSEVETLGFYPIGWRALSLLAIKKVFNWGDEEFRELGAFTTGVSLVVRIYMKFFGSLELLLKKSPQIYNEYFTEGELHISDYDMEKGYAVVGLRGLDLHPIYCRVLEGYLEKFAKMVLKSGNTKCRETKCTFKGDDYHQFKIKWK